MSVIPPGSYSGDYSRAPGKADTKADRRPGRARSMVPTAAYGYEVQANQAVAALNPSPTTIRNLSYSPE